MARSSIFTRDNARYLRVAIGQWERYGECNGFVHLLACGITHQALQPRKRLPMYGGESDINLLLLSMGVAAGYIDAECDAASRS